MTTIDISSISGLTDPYLIQVCDVYGSNCVFLSQIFTTVPPTVTVYLPPQFDSAPSVMVKVTTLDGCEKTKILDCISLYTLTPTPTPSITPTPTCIPQIIYSGEKFSNLPVQNGASFNPDGTALFITLHNNSPEDGVCAYSLSTAWDVSTINLPQTGCSISTPVIPSANYGQYFSPDGYNLFLANGSFNSILKYTLSTPWSVTTSSYSTGDLFNTGVGSGPAYLYFTPDGLNMFINFADASLKKYQLTTPWVINTGVSQIQSLSSVGTFDFTFENNGYYLFTISTSTGIKIVKRTLSIPYDLTSVSLTETSGDLSTFITVGNFYSLNFKDGYKGFIGVYDNTPPNSIYAFELTCEYDINGTIILPTPTPTPTNTVTPTPTRQTLYFNVQLVTTGEPTCSTTGTNVSVTLNPSTILNVNIGDYVELSGSGYVGCWEVISYGTPPTATNITGLFTDCDCTYL